MQTPEERQEQKLQDIGLILRDLLKVIKVVSLYPEGNPLPQSMRRTFAEKLESIVANYGDLKFEVFRNELTYNSQVVYGDRSKEENLAGLFFESGITNVTFKEGLDVEEIYRLLAVIKVYVNSHDKGSDLVALIWEAGISRFAFTTVEDIALAEYDGEFKVSELFSPAGAKCASGAEMTSDVFEDYNALFDSAAGDDRGGGVDSDMSNVVENSGDRPAAADQRDFCAVVPGQANLTIFDDDGIDIASYRTAEAVEAMGLGDVRPNSRATPPDTTLILSGELRLSDEEEEYIRGIINDDSEFDMYESTIELLKELLHQETEMSGFNESVTICEKVMGEVIRAGKLTCAGQILDYFKTLEEKMRKNQPQWADRLRDARITAGSRDRLKVLAEALNDNDDVGQTDLRRYLDLFGWESLAGLTDLLGDLNYEKHRMSLCDFLADRGRENPQIVSAGIQDKRWYVVRNSVIVMSRIGDTRSLGYLKNVIGHPDRRVRLALVQSLTDCANHEALTLLKLAVRDSDHEIRKRAVDAIVARRGPEAFNAIVEILNDGSFTELEQDDQQAVLNAYSVVGGDQAVEYLVGLIKKSNLLGNSSLAFYRIAAFEALSRNRSERGEKALVSLTNSWRTNIKQQASHALQRRRELIFGGQDV